MSFVTRPTVTPTWATDTDYPADSDPDASTPTKVAPSSGYRDMGFRRDLPVIAQYTNYWRNLVGSWLGYLDQQSLQAETRLLADADFTDAGYVLLGHDPGVASTRVRVLRLDATSTDVEIRAADLSTTDEGFIVEVCCRGMTGGHNVLITNNTGLSTLLTMTAAGTCYSRWLWTGTAWLLLSKST